MPWLVFAVGVVVLLPSIWSETSVTCSDEYSLTLRTPMEMNERGEWLTPWCNSEPRLRKPPLLYWLILVSYKVFGTNLVAARLWGVLAGAALGVVAALMERRLFRTTGLLAGLLALATVGVATEARQAMLDLPLALFASLAVLQFLAWLDTPSLSDAVLCAVWVGMSVLVKGPVGMLFFMTGALTAVWVFRKRGLLGRHPWHWALWAILLAVISLPWPLAMHAIWPDRFARVMGEELAARRFGSGMAPLSALSGALGLVAPWTPAVVVAAWHHLRRAGSERPRATSWLIAWVALSAVPFFFMQAFERYMLAVVPPQAVLCSVWLQEKGRAQDVALRIGVGLLALVVVAACGFVLWFELAFWAPVLTLAVAGWLVWRAFRPEAPLAVALGAGVLFMVLFGGTYPALGISAMPPDVARIVGSRIARTFQSSQPALLSMRLGYSVQSFQAAAVKPGTPEAVFVEDTLRPAFEETVRATGLQARELGQLETMYSRKVWLRFARDGATVEDWRASLRSRSLGVLRTPVRIYEVSRASATPRD